MTERKPAGDDDGLEVGSLRAAWRSLPDEEPPARGLAELMAAARAKAVEMAPPAVPWWKKWVSAVMRPPVLAMATLMLLVGGAVLVTSSKHGAVSEEPRGADMAPPPPHETESRGGALAAGSAAPAAATTPVATPTVPAVAAPPIAAPVRKSSPPRPRATRSQPQATPSAPLKLDENADVMPPAAAPPPPPPAPAGSTAGAAQKDEPDDESAPAHTRGTTLKKASDEPSPQTLVAALLVQCRAAAARGDCESTRRIAQRIQAADAAFYRANVATDSSIAACTAANTAN